MSNLRIAIIGAGPAGCSLALLLLKEGIHVTIFEGEASANVRSQGGTLDLHEGTGLTAIRRMGLWDEFSKHVRYDAEALKLCDKNMKMFMQLAGTKEGSSRGRPEIDRKALRDMLVAALPEGTIRWKHRLLKIDEQLNMHFASGIETDFDLIVGADGAWSKVRPLVSTVKPAYSGITGIRMQIPDAANRYPDLYALVNRGSLFSYSDSRNINAQQLGDGSIQFGPTLMVEEGFLKEQANDVPAIQAALHEKFKGWDERLLKFIDAADAEPWVSGLYMLPVGFKWVNRPGVTLIGDAAHVMTPYAGEGVNLALTDAMRLADAIIATAKSGKKGNLAGEVKKFERDMFVRAKKVQQLTYDLMSIKFFTEGGLHEGIEEWIYKVLRDNVPWVLWPLLWTGICAWFKVWRWRN